jgi:hypothetical protein
MITLPIREFRGVDGKIARTLYAAEQMQLIEASLPWSADNRKP